MKGDVARCRRPDPSSGCGVNRPDGMVQGGGPCNGKTETVRPTALRRGFPCSGRCVVILDAGLVTPPEPLPAICRAVAARKGDFTNGTRVVSPYQKGAVQFLDFLVSQCLAAVFSRLLDRCLSRFRPG